MKRNLLKNLPRVSNMTSRNGNDIPNQFIIDIGVAEVFQSYGTIIAVREWGEGITLDTNALDYSVTTSKYLYQFLGSDRRTVKECIADGSYAVADLNNRRG